MVSREGRGFKAPLRGSAQYWDGSGGGPELSSEGLGGSEHWDGVGVKPRKHTQALGPVSGIARLGATIS